MNSNPKANGTFEKKWREYDIYKLQSLSTNWLIKACALLIMFGKQSKTTSLSSLTKVRWKWCITTQQEICNTASMIGLVSKNKMGFVDEPWKNHMRIHQISRRGRNATPCLSDGSWPPLNVQPLRVWCITTQQEIFGIIWRND